MMPHATSVCQSRRYMAAGREIRRISWIPSLNAATPMRSSEGRLNYPRPLQNLALEPLPNELMLPDVATPMQTVHPEDTDQTLGGDKLKPSPLEDIRQYIDSTIESWVARLPVRLIDMVHRRLVSRFELAHMVRAKMSLSDADLECFAQMNRSDLDVLLLKTLTPNLSYAVLSHRWCASEPNLEDVMAHLSEWLPSHLGEVSVFETHSDPGVRKLVMFCKTACSLGYRLAWMDTCCIDKTSSAEYEESINSMYLWYRRAHVCIAHLAQTELRREEALDVSLRSSESDHIKYVLDGSDVNLSVCDIKGVPGWKDEWFSRGWTLQELLAPRAIKFYSNGWEELVSGCPNHKNHLGLLKLLYSTTGIPVDAIHEFNPLGSFTFARKIRWASQRRTQREEDQAYCLLGLFGLNMPILYGEGIDSAFFRLQIEFMRVSSDKSIFSWHGHPLSQNSLLASHPACFRSQTPCIERHPYSTKTYDEIGYFIVIWACLPALYCAVLQSPLGMDVMVTILFTVFWACPAGIVMFGLALEGRRNIIEFIRKVVGVGLHWAIPPSDLGFLFTNAGIRMNHDLLDAEALVDYETSTKASDGQKQWEDYMLLISSHNCVGVRVKAGEITEQNRAALAATVFDETLVLLKPVGNKRQSNVWVKIQTEKPIRGIHRSEQGQTRSRVVYIK